MSEVSAKTTVQTQNLIAPDAPIQGEPSVSENSITVNWEEALMATRYTVYYGTDEDIANAEVVEVGNVTSYTINDLAYGTEYLQ